MTISDFGKTLATVYQPLGGPVRRTYSRRALLFACTCTVVLALFTVVIHDDSSSAAHDPEPEVATTASLPNIVFVLVDDMAADDLRAMPRTKRLIAQAGVTFRNSISTFPLCCPARVTLLTGQYAHTHGVLGNGDPQHPEGGYEDFPLGENTVATWLNDAGYQTAMVGKYLNGYGEGDTPLLVPEGWDEWHGIVSGSYRSPEVFEDGTRHS